GGRPAPRRGAGGQQPPPPHRGPDRATAAQRHGQGRQESTARRIGRGVTMKVEELLEKAKGAVDIHQASGEPYERNGITIIPVARVSGGGGGGKGIAP